MFDFVFEFANDEQRRELDAAIDLISWGLEFETGCKAQSWKQIQKYRISAVGKNTKKAFSGKNTNTHSVEKNTNTQLVGKKHKYTIGGKKHKYTKFVAMSLKQLAIPIGWLCFFHNGT